MRQSAGSIRDELGDAVVYGIRQHGADAVGVLIIGIARLIVGAAACGLLLAVGAVFGYEASVGHFAGLAGLSTLVTWLAAGRSTTSRRGRDRI